ncbi:13587_t:CDS:1 [Cetraspora pellucida]|uniref:13587_t:CDS:1 n=1 Tax=Cetraspora pellucida TaxID=1433469 RepID=A0A9N9BMF4_9GLOM|nr:13587_t:CDS:1 [Cetraspora pellucida]
MSINKFSSFKLPETIKTSVKHKTDKNKEGRPRMPIWNNYDKRGDNRHRHFGASCHYCNRRKWQYIKLSTIEAHLALHCKGPVPDDIRRKWLIKVVKRGEKANDDRDDEFFIKKNLKPIN